MFHICAAVSTHPSIYGLNDLVTLSISNKQHLTLSRGKIKRKGCANMETKNQETSHQEKWIFIVHFFKLTLGFVILQNC